MISCFCEDEFDNFNEFYNARDVTARKSHVCCECKRTIELGEKYESVAGKSDGDFFTVKTCLMCTRIRNEMFPCGFAHGTLWSTIHREFCRWDGLEEGDEEYFCICPPKPQKSSACAQPVALKASDE